MNERAGDRAFRRRGIGTVAVLVAALVPSVVSGLGGAAVATAAPTTVPADAREEAHARVWSGVDAVRTGAAVPGPQTPRVPAESTVDVPDCPSYRTFQGGIDAGGQPVRPGPGQVAVSITVVVDDDGETDVLAYLIDAGRWTEASCPILNNPFVLPQSGASPARVAIGPGTVLMWQLDGGGQQLFYEDFSFTPPSTSPFARGAVLTNADALKVFNQCPGCDLSKANLSNLEFPSNTNLLGANVSGASFVNLRLEFADLTRATFGVAADGTPATMAGSDFSSSRFVETSFDRTVFTGAYFGSALFYCPSFKDSVLIDGVFLDVAWPVDLCPSVTFDGTVLGMDTVPPEYWRFVRFDRSTIVVDAANRAAAKGIRLSAWSFTNSQFVGLPPDLSGMTVSDATLDGSSFMLADLTGTTFSGPTSIQRTVFVDAVLDGVELPGAVAHGAVFTGASLEGAVFDGARLGRGPNASSPLPTATFRNADAHGASFADVQARGVAFDGAYLYPGDAVVSFSGAELEGASFSGAVLGRTDFTDITAPSIRFARAQCVNCDFTGARMASASFDSAYIYGATFKGATMPSASFLNAACCSSGTWTYALGSDASAPSEPYAVNPAEPSLNGPEFDDIGQCPSGLSPGSGSSSGCAGQTAPQQPPLQPACSAAADHECTLDIELLGGTGTPGYSDGGPQRDAKLAAFSSPSDVAYDPRTGDVIVADTANRVVRRIAGVSSTAPQVSIVAGAPPAPGSDTSVVAPAKRTRPRPGGPASVPTLIAPSGVATRVANSTTLVAMADRGSSIVFTTTRTGVARPIAGTGVVCPAPTDACGDGGPGPRAELNAPRGVWYDPNGNLYIADTGNNRIRRLDTRGIITTVAGTGQSGYTGDAGAATAATLAGPTDVVGDRLGNLYVADAGNAAIRRIDPTGTITTLAGGDGSLTSPTSVAVDGRNRLYLTDTGTSTVATLNLFGIARPTAGTGTAGYSGDGGPALSAELNGPLGVAAVGDDTLFVADTANARIRIIGPAS